MTKSKLPSLVDILPEGFLLFLRVGNIEAPYRIQDATIALRMLDKIMSLPDYFRPAQSSLLYLQDVEFNYTAVLFVRTAEGQQYRIEADVDRTLEPLVGCCPYQLGSNRLFYDNKTNRRIQVEILDVEK